MLWIKVYIWNKWEYEKRLHEMLGRQVAVTSCNLHKHAIISICWVKELFWILLSLKILWCNIYENILLINWSMSLNMFAKKPEYQETLQTWPSHFCQGKDFFKLLTQDFCLWSFNRILWPTVCHDFNQLFVKCRKNEGLLGLQLFEIAIMNWKGCISSNNGVVGSSTWNVMIPKLFMSRVTFSFILVGLNCRLLGLEKLLHMWSCLCLECVMTSRYYIKFVFLFLG